MPIPAPKNAIERYSGELLHVWTWEQELFDGSLHLFECLTRPDTVTVIPFVDADTVLFTRQEQPGRGTFMDFAGGRIDPGEKAEQAARRELQEETGHEAITLFPWLHKEHRGLVRFEEYIYLAHVRPAGKTHQDPGERIDIFFRSWDDTRQACLQRELRNVDAMFSILQMAFDPESQRRFAEFRASLPPHTV